MKFTGMKLTVMLALGALAVTRIAVAVPATTPVTLAGATQFDLESKIAGRTYRIFVYKPLTPPPDRGGFGNNAVHRVSVTVR